MNAKRILKGSISAILAASMLAGCSSNTATSASAKSEDEKITATITVWGPQEDQSDDNGNWLKKETEAFAKEHPNWNLTFKYGVCSEADASKTVTADPEAAADVYMFANDQIGTLVDANAISKLGGDTLKQIKKNNSDAVVNTVTYNGDVYGVPYTGNTWFLYYNKKVISDEDAKSLDSMMKDGKVSFSVNDSWYIAGMFAANGATFFGDDGQDESAGIKLGDNASAVTDYLIDALASGQLVNDDNGSGLAGMADGSVSAMFSGSWDYQNVVDAIGKENVGIAALPTVNINGKDEQMMSFAGSKAVAANPNCKYPEVAVALAAYLGGASAQKDHYDLRNIIPTDSSIDISGDALAEAQSDTMNKTSILQPSWSEMGNWWTPAENFGNAIINGEVTKANSADKTSELETQVNTSSVN
jgi:arabinogalactan oligomer/maltooligosaccharide transport system substrate-binding protein